MRYEYNKLVRDGTTSVPTRTTFLFSFSYNIAELAMCHYFETHKRLVDR